MSSGSSSGSGSGASVCRDSGAGSGTGTRQASGQGSGSGSGSTCHGSGTGSGTGAGSGSGSGGSACVPSGSGSSSGSGVPACVARGSGSGSGSGSGTNAVAACPARQVTSVVMKRIPVMSGHFPGHWWFEINGDESYGWYPVSKLPVTCALSGSWASAGELNGVTYHGGTATRDPHHGSEADVTFSPMTQDGDCRSDEEIQQCLRDYVSSYSPVADASWRWPGRCNCHDLQLDAMQNCNLTGPPGDRVWG
jgi:hypothetical protein